MNRWLLAWALCALVALAQSPAGAAAADALWTSAPNKLPALESQSVELAAAHQPVPGDEAIGAESILAAPGASVGEVPLDEPLTGYEPLAGSFELVPSSEPWDFELLPDGLIYRSYMAGVKESRMASAWNYEENLGWIWDISLGGRVGVMRWGTTNDFRPEGWQLDLEGAGQPRLDIENERDLVAADFRFGIPLTYGVGRYQMKVAFYHLSSHVGDEFMVRNRTFNRFNYSRDVMVWGHSLDLTDAIRFYTEAGWALRSDVAEPWEFQFGFDIAPPCPTGVRGAPFAAINGHLREEVDFGGNLVVQTGWMWRGSGGNHTLRTGLQYFNGKSEQFSFFNQSEQKLGLGLWYDF